LITNLLKIIQHSWWIETFRWNNVVRKQTLERKILGWTIVYHSNL